MFQKDIIKPLAFDPDRIIPSFTTKSVTCILQANIKPYFEYCCLIWGKYFNFSVHKIEKIQRRACKLILGNDFTLLDDARKQLNMLLFEYKQS